jgi:hypothetical protein
MEWYEKYTGNVLRKAQLNFNFNFKSTRDLVWCSSILPSGKGGVLLVRIVWQASYVRQQVIFLGKKFFVIDIEAGWSVDTTTSVFERSVKIRIERVYGNDVRQSVHISSVSLTRVRTWVLKRCLKFDSSFSHKQLLDSSCIQTHCTTLKPSLQYAIHTLLVGPVAQSV